MTLYLKEEKNLYLIFHPLITNPCHVFLLLMSENYNRRNFIRGLKKCVKNSTMSFTSCMKSLTYIPIPTFIFIFQMFGVPPQKKNNPPILRLQTVSFGCFFFKV